MKHAFASACIWGLVCCSFLIIRSRGLSASCVFSRVASLKALARSLSRCFVSFAGCFGASPPCFVPPTLPLSLRLEGAMRRSYNPPRLGLIAVNASSASRRLPRVILRQI